MTHYLLVAAHKSVSLNDVCIIEALGYILKMGYCTVFLIIILCVYAGLLDEHILFVKLILLFLKPLIFIGREMLGIYNFQWFKCYLFYGCLNTSFVVDLCSLKNTPVSLYQFFSESLIM